MRVGQPDKCESRKASDPDISLMLPAPERHGEGGVSAARRSSAVVCIWRTRRDHIGPTEVQTRCDRHEDCSISPEADIWRGYSVVGPTLEGRESIPLIRELHTCLVVVSIVIFGKLPQRRRLHVSALPHLAPPIRQTSATRRDELPAGGRLLQRRSKPERQVQYQIRRAPSHGPIGRMPHGCPARRMGR